MSAASQSQINSLAKQFGLTPEAVSSQIKGSSYDYGLKVLKNNAAKTSGGSVSNSSNDAISAAQNYSTGLGNLVKDQNARQDALFNKYQELSGSQETLGNAYTRMQNEAGVPDLNAQLQTYKDQIYATKALLDALDENVKTRTSGTFTNNAQVNRQIAAEGTPLNTTLSRLGNAEAPILDRLTSAGNNITTQLGFMQSDQAKELQPLTMQINSLSDKFAREMTAYTTGQQAELTALTDKIKRDQTLTDQEWARANQLADAETAWDQKKQELQIQFENDVKLKQTKGASTGSGSSYTPTTDVINNATSILDKWDIATNKSDTGDKSLSADEFSKALQDLTSIYGSDKAQKIMDAAWVTGGYTKYNW